jgi:hypothetical protein
MDGVDTQLTTEGQHSHQQKRCPETDPVTYRTACELEAFHLLKCHFRIFGSFVLNECVALAASSHRVPVQVNKLKLAKWLKDLFDIGFGEVEM